MRRFVCLAVLILCFPLTSCKNDSTTGSTQQPSISQMTPAMVNPGQSNIEGHILGSNLNGVLSVSLGDGVTVHQMSGISPSDIYLFFSVSRDAYSGLREVIVRTSSGAATSSSVFSIGDNKLPIARFSVTPPAGVRDTVFRFDASGSSDPDGSITSYQWRFEDGTQASGRVVTHKFKRSGTLKAELTITDNRGASERISKFIDVDASKPPVAQFNVSPTSGTTNTLFTFDGSASLDPDGRISEYRWSFGDGTTAIGRQVQHRFSAVDSYNVNLVVLDNTGMTGSADRDLRVDTAPPEPPPPGPDPDPGGGGEICTGNNVFGQEFTVLSVSGNTLTGSVSFVECPGLCGELRRNAQGLQEFAGWIQDVSGSQITFSLGGFSSSHAPVTGEHLRAVWLECGQ